MTDGSWKLSGSTQERPELRAGGASQAKGVAWGRLPECTDRGVVALELRSGDSKELSMALWRSSGDQVKVSRLDRGLNKE